MHCGFPAIFDLRAATVRSGRCHRRLEPDHFVGADEMVEARAVGVGCYGAAASRRAFVRSWDARSWLESNSMEREANKARSFAEAEQWDRQQQWAMTPDERHAIAKELRDRFYGVDAPDVRESERAK